MKKEKFAELYEFIEQTKTRSAWARGVKEYAIELLDQLQERGYILESINDHKTLKNCLLNGADDWNAYSWGGCSLIFDEDVAERLCTPSELKKTDHGRRNPNKREQWLDVQERALYQAYILINKKVNALKVFEV